MNRYWPRRRYVHLRHRIFAAIVVSILVTAGCVVLATHLFASGGYRGELSSVESFVSARFVDVWDNAQRRERLAGEIESSFGVSLIMRDTAGRLISVMRAAVLGQTIDSKLTAHREASARWRFVGTARPDTAQWLRLVSSSVRPYCGCSREESHDAWRARSTNYCA